MMTKRKRFIKNEADGRGRPPEKAGFMAGEMRKELS